MLGDGLAEIAAIKNHEQIAVHAVGKQRCQGKQINYQADVLNVVGHSSVGNINIPLVGDTAKN